jgi:alkylated DNA nucleotide flippase Atl1
VLRVIAGSGHDGTGPRAAVAVPDFASAVLDVVDLIPRGRVMTYGDVAEYLGYGGPRQVGQVMARWGGAVTWWRVLKADGSPPPGHEPAALREYRRERTPLRPDGRRVDLRRARWDGVSESTATPGSSATPGSTGVRHGCRPAGL